MRAASTKLISRDRRYKSRLPCNYLIIYGNCASPKDEPPFTDADPGENRSPPPARARIEFPQIHVARSAITAVPIS